MGIKVVNKSFYINGEKIPDCPTRKNNMSMMNVTIINDKIFMDGYEYKPKLKEWKKTLRAWFHLYF